jgi:hypothetical protein
MTEAARMHVWAPHQALMRAMVLRHQIW